MKPKEGPQALSKEHINHKNLQGHNALGFAIKNKMHDVELKLIVLVADNHPLLAACKEGREDMAFKLLGVEDNINHADENGETALTYAIGNHMKDTALELIRRGANCDVVTKKKDTPLQMACRKNKETGTGLPEVAKELLKGPNEGRPGLSKEHIDMVKPFDPKINPRTGHYALYHAIDSRMTDIALDIIRRGARCNVPTYHGDTPLEVACNFGLTEIAKELLKGSDKGGPALSTEHINHKNYHGATSLLLAISSHMLDVMKMLIDRGGECGSMLHTACQTSFDEGVVYLLTSPKNKKHIEVINENGEDGMMPLEWAVKNHLSGAIVELLKQGARLRNKKGSLIEIKSEDFKAFLDELVTVEKYGKWSQKEDERLVFNYKFLYEGGHDNTPILNSILNLSPEHKEVVKHPLVQAILVKKWKKMLPVWVTWIILKIIFFGLIVVFASILYTSSQPGTVESDTVLVQDVKEATKDSCQNLT